MKHAWGWSAVVIGAWEAAAMSSRLPTVSRIIWRLIRRHPLFARLLLGAWLTGLAKHLAVPPKEGR